VNTATALWSRAKSEITDDEYTQFYKHVAHDFEDPLAWVHSRVEGRLEYTSLLYIPSRAPFDLWDRGSRHGVSLYVRRVFIMDDAEKLMPPYLRFVRGVIDSADLPLNVSREILQQSREIDSIRSGSVKKVLDLIASLAADEPDKFDSFWKNFGKVLKEGVVDDARNRDTIAPLLRFASTHGEGERQSVSLDDYVGRMKPGQQKIYYVTADRHATALHSPHLEIFQAKSVEVLLLTDEIDEWLVHTLDAYKEHAFASVAKGDPELDAVESSPSGDQACAGTAGKDGALDNEALVSRLKQALGERVRDVRVSRRLTHSPACLVVEDHDMSAHLERLLKAAGQPVSAARPILEVNPDHVMVQRFGAEEDDAKAREWAAIFFEQALLSEGGRLEDPAGFVRRMNDMFVAMSD
jgi:molecular chaperone HtpG